MNETQFPSADESGASKSLDERFVNHPQVYQRLQEIADQLDRAIEDRHTGDQAEEMTIEEVRKLGADLLSDWASARSAQSVENARREHPEAIADSKKNSNGKPPLAP
jgi:hypothetical protein